jgi:PadR family transcriptional regulator, regulatory protein AphA
VERTLTTTSHALLGLLRLRPWTTYELAKQVHKGLGWFWPRAERKLYDEPKHLVAAGLATATQEATGRRPRTVYRITPAGRRALRAWLEEPSAPPVLEMEALVRVFFADGGSKQSLLATLDGVGRHAQSQIDDLVGQIEASRSDDYGFTARHHINALALRYELDRLHGTARWATWARDQVDQWPSTTDPGDWDWVAAITPPT